MAYNPVTHFDAFVSSRQYLHRYPWLDPANHGNVINPDENTPSDVRLMGWSGQEANSPLEWGVVNYNCIGWAFGINRTLGTRQGPLAQNPTMPNDESIKIWVNETRAKALGGEINPTIANNNYSVHRVRVQNHIIQRQNGNEWVNYQPVENDIALFFKDEDNAEDLVNAELQHAALYFDVHRVYGDTQNRLHGTNDYQPNYQWTSKCGDLKLLQYPLSRMDGNFDFVNNEIDVGESYNPIIANKHGPGGYGYLHFILSCQ